jgi:hypothetical protein
MAYNLLDLRTRVRTKIKDSSYSAATIDGYINDAQVEIADLYPWKYFQKIVAGDLTVGEYTYVQQDDHQITTRLILIHPTSTTSYWDMTKYYRPHESFFNIFPAPDAQDNSQPAYWTEYGNQIYFNSPVNLAYTMRQYYQKIPTELSSDSSIPELPISFREALVLGAAYRCEEERDNYDIAATLQNRFNDRVADLMNRFANETMTAPDTIVQPGYSEDDY